MRPKELEERRGPKSVGQGPRSRIWGEGEVRAKDIEVGRDGGKERARHGEGEGRKSQL